MILVAPDHIQSGTGSLLAKETSATQGAISGKYLFTPGNIVYSKIRPYLRKAILADFEGLCSADMYPLQPREGITPRYLLAVMLSEHFSRFAEIVSMRSGFPKINREELAEYWAPVPPPLEQSRIAEILDTVDEAIRQSEQLIAKLKQMKQGLLHDLLTRGIDDNGELRDPDRHPEQFQGSALGGIPLAWTIIELGEVVPRAVYGISVSLEADRGVPVLRMNNLKDGEADLDDLKYSDSVEAQELLLHPGDVLFNRTNSIEHVGRTGIWRGQLEKASFASYLVRLEPDRGRLSGEFLNRWLNWAVTQIRIRRVATPGVHQVNINPTNLRKTRIALPRSVHEQERIASILMAHDVAARNEERDLAKLRLMKQGLMEDLLTGRVRVTELAPAP